MCADGDVGVGASASPPARWVACPVAMSDRTLVICKPDAVERGLVGTILDRFERRGLAITALELRTLDEEILARHYEEHQGKGFYAELVAFMSRGPVVLAAIEGPEDTWKVVRDMMGATNPRNAAPGTIRGDLRHRVHGEPDPRQRQRGVGRARAGHLLPRPVAHHAGPQLSSGAEVRHRNAPCNLCAAIRKDARAVELHRSRP